VEVHVCLPSLLLFNANWNGKLTVRLTRNSLLTIFAVGQTDRQQIRVKYSALNLSRVWRHARKLLWVYRSFDCVWIVYFGVSRPFPRGSTLEYLTVHQIVYLSTFISGVSSKIARGSMNRAPHQQQRPMLRNYLRIWLCITYTWNGGGTCHCLCTWTHYTQDRGCIQKFPD